MKANHRIDNLKYQNIIKVKKNLFISPSSGRKMSSKYENLAIFIIIFSRTSHFRPIFTSVYEIQKNIKFVKIIVRVATLWSKINLKKLKSSDFLIFSYVFP